MKLKDLVENALAEAREQQADAVRSERGRALSIVVAHLETIDALVVYHGLDIAAVASTPPSHHDG